MPPEGAITESGMFSPFDWKYSFLLLISALIVPIVTGLMGVDFSMQLLGSGAATITDLRFLIIGLIGLLGLRRLNVVVLGLAAGFAYKAYLHLTLQEHWKMLGISKPFSDGLIESFYAGIVFFALVHVAFSMFGATKSGEKQ